MTLILELPENKEKALKAKARAQGVSANSTPRKSSRAIWNSL